MPQHKCCRDSKPENAARPFKNPAPVLTRTEVKDLIQAASGKNVIEYGGGALRNALYLQKAGCNVVVVELSASRRRFQRKYSFFEKLGGKYIPWESVTKKELPRKGRYQLAVITFVIETICCPKQRIQLLIDCHRRLVARGSLVISIRGVADVATAHAKGHKCSDGYITPQKTFVRPFTCLEVIELLHTTGFSSVRLLHKRNTLSPELIHAIATK